MNQRMERNYVGHACSVTSLCHATSVTYRFLQ
jgi:hypothetical protein